MPASPRTLAALSQDAPAHQIDGDN
jgi:hypothetical protein